MQGEWLILADRGGVGAQLSALLEANGDTCTLRFADATPELPAPDRPLKGVIHLWSLDLAPADIAARRRASASAAPGQGACVTRAVGPAGAFRLVTSAR